jgi:hypothetical protein
VLGRQKGTHFHTVEIWPAVVRGKNIVNLSGEALGNFETLRERLDAELVALKSPGASIGLLGAWSRVPASSAPRSAERSGR